MSTYANYIVQAQFCIPINPSPDLLYRLLIKRLMTNYVIYILSQVWTLAGTDFSEVLRCTQKYAVLQKMELQHFLYCQIFLEWEMGILMGKKMNLFICWIILFEAVTT